MPVLAAAHLAPGSADDPGGPAGAAHVVRTFLFTDVQGYAALWERAAQAMPAVSSRHLECLSRIIRDHAGVVFKTMGDQVCAAFEDPSGAVRAALSIQLALMEPEPLLGERLLTRVAIHTGAAERVGADFFGRAVNRVSRVLAAGHGGQTLLTLATHEMVRGVLPAGVSAVDLGLHRLRDLGEERLFQIVEPRLPREFPALRTLDARLTNLPTPLSAFWGREAELAQIAGAARSHRLVTLTGPGGVGKTRLALQSAGTLADLAPAGIWLVELAGLSRGEDVPAAIAGALSLREQGGRGDLSAVQSAIADKPMLLVIDNAEHVVDAAAAAARKLLENSPHLRLIVTSRAPLYLPGERVIPIAPLPLPGTDTPAGVMSSDAARLFAERARAHEPAFALDQSTSSAVAEICRAVEGLPLGLELAAARVADLGVQELARRLPSRVVNLNTLDHTAPARQESVRASIEWSYRLLAPQEQALFRRLSMFAGGFSLAWAEGVCGDGLLVPRFAADPLPGVGEPIVPGPVLPEADVAERLSVLVRGSMAIRERTPQGDRYRLLHPLRGFGRHALETAGEAPALARRHALWALSEVERLAQNLTGPEQKSTIQALESDLDNLRAAMDHAERDVLLPALCMRLAVAMGPFFYQRGLIAEGRAWTMRGLQSRPDAGDRLHARALGWAGNMAWAEGDRDVALRHGESAVDLWTRLGDQRALAGALSNLGNLLSDAGRASEAVSLHQRAVAIYRDELKDPYFSACAELNLAVSLGHEGQWLQLVDVLSRTLPIFETRDRFRHSAALRNLAEGYWRLKRPNEADPAIRSAMRYRLEVKDTRTLGSMLLLGAAIQIDLDRPALGACWLGLAEMLLADAGGTRPTRPDPANVRELLASRLTPTELSTRLDEGRHAQDFESTLMRTE